MSDIVKKVDKAAAAVIASADDDRGRAGSSMLAPEDLEIQLESILKWMRGPRNIIDSTGSFSVPRLGLLSLILQQTPVHVYGHPALKKISKTAFTDGMHVFLSDDFVDKINADVENDPSTFGVEWVIMHEIMHKLFNHTRRLKRFPHDIANRATDLSINTKLDEGFPDMKPCRSLVETGLGFKSGDKDRWMHLSEETIAMELMALRGLNKQRKQEADENKQDQKDQKKQKGQDKGDQGQPSSGKGQQPGKGKGQDQKGQPGSGGSKQDEESDPLNNLDEQDGGGEQDGPEQGGQDGQGQAGGKGGKQKGAKGNQKGGQGSGGEGEDEGEEGPGHGEGAEESEEPSEDFGAEGDNHFVDPADLIKVLEENGMDAVKEKLGLPDSDDIAGIGEMQESARLKQNEAVMQAQASCSKLGGKYPGAHIVESAGEMVKNFGKPKITWRMLQQDLILGYSPKSMPSMEEPMDLRYVPSMMDVLGMEPYLPQLMPHFSEEAVLFLVDTSGSMSQEAMRKALTEAIELKTAASNMGDAASTVFIWPCDTVLRGLPLEINDSNVEDYITGGIEMKGRGGTSIDTCINQAMASPLLADKKIKAIVYCSDLYDAPVPRPTSLEDSPEVRVLFLADPETPRSHVETFAKGTSWADVSVIEDDLEVDFEQIGEENRAVAPPVRKRKMR